MDAEKGERSDNFKIKRFLRVNYIYYNDDNDKITRG
ncbi:Uncharacterised protein [uncultured archaeon]|nr:Uncharacterised protein [uncultured archaeon]